MPVSQLAQHHEAAGHDEKAARLFNATVTRMQDSGGGDLPTVIAMLRRALACVKRCEESAPVQQLEMVLLRKLVSTYACSPEEMERCVERFIALRDRGFGGQLTTLQIAMATAWGTRTWSQTTELETKHP